MVVPKKRGPLWLILGLALTIMLGVIGPPAGFLGWVWWHDPKAPLPPPAIGTNDMGRLSPNTPAEVITAPADIVAAEHRLAAVVRRASTEGRAISVSGARHSMGGQTLAPGGIVLDMEPLKHMRIEAREGILTVGAGARWRDVIPYLDHLGRAVTVMQSNSDFSVGGSLSVNCHGWQHNSPPIASSVESLRLLRADGEVVTCSLTENSELFRLALGGYGLFGVILEARLRTVPNEFYRDERHTVFPADYVATYHDLTRQGGIGMAYGRISVAPESFLRQAHVTLLRRQENKPAVCDTLTGEVPGWDKRLVVRGSVGSDYGKNLRWFLEKHVGEAGNAVRSRNQVMMEPSEWYLNRKPAETEILHEYFIPGDQLAPFLEAAQPVFRKFRPDLLNITVRNVTEDKIAYLAYAREEVFGLVMLFHLHIATGADDQMKAFTRALIDVALDHRGTYYLPYRLHATRAQLLRAYPNAEQFFALKRRYDPTGVFQNQFFLTYGSAGPDAQPATKK